MRKLLGKYMFYFLIVTCLISCNKLNISSIEKVIGYYSVDFTMGTEMGIIENNSIKFYSLIYDEWLELTGLEFILPKNCNNIIEKVFGNKGFGTIIDNEIIFYEYSDNIGWNEITYGKFILPENYVKVITLYDKIGIVINNEINFYWYDWNKNNWEKIIDSEFNIPRRYNKIISFTDSAFGIVYENVLKIYGYNGFWDEIMELELKLPDDFINIGFINYDWLTILTKEKIIFYYYSETGWEIINNIEFKR